MTKTLFVLSAFLLIAVIALFIGGVSASAPGLMMVSLLCAAPLFFLILGAAIGRASQEFSVVRRTNQAGRATIVNSRIERAQAGASSLK